MQAKGSPDFRIQSQPAALPATSSLRNSRPQVNHEASPGAAFPAAIAFASAVAFVVVIAVALWLSSPKGICCVFTIAVVVAIQPDSPGHIFII
jgi:hypothetical protein